MKFLKKYEKEIQHLCEKHEVSRLYVFGSVAREDFSVDSDIDFMVRFKSIDLINYFDNYLNFKSALKSLLNKEVDLLEEQTLKNPYLIKQINSDKELVYG